MFEALVRRGEEVHKGEGCFATAKPKPKQRGPLEFAKAKANLRRGEATFRRGEGRTQQKTTLEFTSAKAYSPR